MKIYLDMCCYNRPYDDQSQFKIFLETQCKLYIQDLIKEEKFDLVGSFTLDYEISRNPFEMRKQAISNFIHKHMHTYVSAKNFDKIKIIADEIMMTGVKEKDAFHVASAIYSGCKYFITTDLRLLKYKTDSIQLVSPIEFIIETGDEE